MFILGNISLIKKTAYGVSEGRKSSTDPRSRLGRTPWPASTKTLENPANSPDLSWIAPQNPDNSLFGVCNASRGADGRGDPET